MLKNYFLVTLRNLTRHKGYSLINISGLAIGMSCFILVLLMVNDEFSYDRFHADAGNLYRVRVDARLSEREFASARSSAPVAGAMVAGIPGVQAATHFRVVGDRTIRYGDKAFTEFRFYLADSSIFDVFSFHVLEGDVRSFLHGPNTVVITDEVARKYFGSAPALGKTLTLDGTTPLQVCGVVKAFPAQSHWHFGFLASETTWRNNEATDWIGNHWYTYARLKEGVSAAQVEAALAGITKTNVLPRLRQVFSLDGNGLDPERFHYRYMLQPITDIHLYSHLDEELEPTGTIGIVTMFSIVAMFVLLIACINFMNLNTARSSHRAKEVGVRKVLGSTRGQLVQLFLSEAFVLALVALVVSLAIVEQALPAFNAYTGKGLSLGSLGVFRLAGGLLLLSAVVGVLAGSYPAFVLSAFRPADVLKGKLRKGMRSGRLRGVLVVMQFAISIALIIGTIVVYRQLQFIRSRDLGFSKENLFVVDNTWLLGSKYESFKQVVRNVPGVVDAAFAQELPGNDIGSGAYLGEGSDRSQLKMLRQLWADMEYLPALGVKLHEGRFLSRNFPADSMNSVLINRAAARLLGYEHPLGRTLSGFFGDRERKFTIVGVTEDFHYEPLNLPIMPMVIMSFHGGPTRLVIRVQGDPRGQVEEIKRLWESISGGQPYRAYFLDQRIERYYKSDESLGELFGILASLGIFLSCLGLLGLAMFATEQRTKEMGIRKVLGATAPGLTLLLTKEFVKLVIIANIIAWPVAYFGMQRWLETFAYHVDQGVGDYVAAGALALVIALATVTYHTVKVAFANPVESLRYE
jgi:putative ABC transport system permease protein